MAKLISWAAAVVTGLVLLVGMPAGAASATAPLGGAQLRYLPPGLGQSTDFEYEYDDVSFAARVWESGSDAGGWQVDLDVQVMRGARLTGPRALHDWFIGYEQRPPSEARYLPMLVHGRHGWACRDEVFWLVRPGLAVSVGIDRSRWSAHALLRTARGVRLRW
jgi:hypothetical protein